MFCVRPHIAVFLLGYRLECSVSVLPLINTDEYFILDVQLLLICRSLSWDRLRLQGLTMSKQGRDSHIVTSTRQITLWAHLRMYWCEWSRVVESFQSLCAPPRPTTSTPPVQVTLHYCAAWVETDTGVLHLWCSLSSASSLWSCDSETQHRGPAASHFTFQGLLWLPRPQTEGHLTLVSAGAGGKNNFLNVHFWTTIVH